MSKVGSSQRWLAWLYIFGGSAGLTGSLMLSIEVYNRLKNPGYAPACNLNPVLSCTSVADSAQSHIFGFPNYFIGIGAFAALMLLGAGILAGGQFNRWFWRLVQLGVTLALAFITWLQFESLYRIGALCIFCMLVWTVTAPIFWYTTLHNLRQRNLLSSKRLRGIVNFSLRFQHEILASWFLVILVLILKRFWYYWSSLF